MRRIRLRLLPLSAFTGSLLVLSACYAAPLMAFDDLAPEPNQFIGSAAPTGKVGVMALDNGKTVPRAVGMQAHLRGCLISHPALGRNLIVNRNGRLLPMLSFLITLHITDSAGAGGLESLAGRGKLRIFYSPRGCAINVPSPDEDPGTYSEIEEDDVSFRSEQHLGVFMIRMNETAITTHQFAVAGARFQTPVGRYAADIMVAEFDPSTGGLAFASTSVMASSTPRARLAALMAPLNY